MRDEVGPSLILLGLATAALGLAQPNLAPLTALGLAVVAVGFLTTWEPAARESIIVKLAEAGWENTSALVQATGLPPRAFYMPSKAVGRPVAVIATKPPGRIPRDALSFKTEGGPALVLSTPGTKAVELCGELPQDLEEALRSCVVNHLALARSVEVAQRGDKYVVEYKGVTAPSMYDKLPLRAALGTVIASVTAAVVAEALGRAVEVVEERREGKRHIVVLQ